MKCFSKIIVAALAVMMLAGCDNIQRWNDFPVERFKSYAPYSVGDKLTFVGDDANITLEVTDVNYTYEFCGRRTKCPGLESFSLQTDFFD